MNQHLTDNSNEIEKIAIKLGLLVKLCMVNWQYKPFPFLVEELFSG